jgi:hypothetical protein
MGTKNGGRREREVPEEGVGGQNKGCDKCISDRQMIMYVSNMGTRDSFAEIGEQIPVKFLKGIGKAIQKNVQAYVVRKI